jgi:hypothetical protein
VTGHYIAKSAPVDTAPARPVGCRSSTTERNPAANGLHRGVVLHGDPARGAWLSGEAR